MRAEDLTRVRHMIEAAESAMRFVRLIPADVVVMSRSAFERQRHIPNMLAYRVAQEGVAREPGR